MQVALAGSHLHVEVRDPARRDLEDRDARLEQVPVEDDAGVSPTLVRREEVDDRVPADSSSPSQVKRTLTGSAPSAASSAAAFSRRYSWPLSSATPRA